MNRTTFLVDGFNLYHSLRAASEELGGAPTKWLDLAGLLRSYLYAIGGGAQVEQIFYFSALATHLEQRQPGVTVRHRNYIDCLKTHGVIPVLGRFKPKEVYCGTCRRTSIRYEEKETDVAMSVKLIEILHLDAADTIALVTGDTDLAPAVRTARALFPTKRFWFLFPYKRKNKELAQIADGHINIKKARYLEHQLPPSVTLASGRIVNRPASWS
jgi:uncharacterized LabA/DUF88 family protein